MIETLMPLEIPPGIFRNGTKLDARGRWYDGNCVRWVEGYAQPIGGWRVAQDSDGDDVAAVSGVPRGLYAWRASSGLVLVGIGTHTKLYIFSGGELSDITPAIFTTGDDDSALVGGTYGAGVYGAGPYGTGSGALTLNEADTWQLDNFGDYLVGVLSSDGKLLVWQGDTGVAAAVADADAPIDNTGVVVTPERFIVVLGAGGNIRKVQWPTQEGFDDWTQTADNTAGDFELQTNGRLMCGQRTKNETLLWTDVDLHTMTYIGGELIYSFNQAGDACGIVSPRAKVVIDTAAFWMGRSGFFKYDGFVQPIACEVHDYVFEDINLLQAAKFWAMTLAEFGEVVWYYCSAGSSEIDRYVAYNYRAGHWTYGKLARTAGIDAGPLRWPLLLGADGTLYEHEQAETRSGADTPFLESGPIVLDPNKVIRVQRIVPDGTSVGDVDFTVITSMEPLESETEHEPASMASITDIRATGKYLRVRIEEAEPIAWRVGLPQLGIIPLGRR